MLNDHPVHEIEEPQMDANISMLQPEELMRELDEARAAPTQEQFMRMMLAATSGKV